MMCRKLSLAALFCSVLPLTSASALPVNYCKDGPGIDLVGDGCVSAQGDGFYSNAGGGDPEAKVEEAILQATGVAVDIALFGASDSNPSFFTFTPNDGASLTVSTNGSWSVNNGTWISYITIKGSNSFALYSLSPATASGIYTTLGLLTNGGQQPDVSHIRFWTTGSNTAVPEPATAAMLALGAGAVLRRRNRK